MNNWAKVGAIGIAMLFVFMVVPGGSTALASAENTQELNAVAANTSLVVFSDELNASEQYKGLAAEVTQMNVEDSFSAVSEGDIVLLESSWIATQQTASLATDIYQVVRAGAPVIIASDSTELIENVGQHLGSISYLDDAQFYGVAYSPETGTKFNYSVGGFDTDAEALAVAYEWATTVATSAAALTQTNGFDLTQLGDETLRQFSYNCGDFGIMSGSNLYYSLNDTSADYNYYLTHYRFQATPYSGKAIADMVIYSTCAANAPSGQTQQLYDYEPKAVAGGLSIPVKLTAGLSDAGFSLGAEILWTFTLPDVTFHDNSAIGANLMDHWYEFNECSETAYHAYMVEPGNVVKVSTGADGAYHATEEYRVTFCNIVLAHNWHNNFTEFRTTVHETIYP